MNMILLGAPGTGKGTQAEKISEKLGIPTISTGAMLRAAIREGTPFGKQAKAFIDKGELVPDDVMIGLIQDRLQEPDCKDGFILDGFPRTSAQAEALERFGIRIDMALSFEVPDAVIIKRLSGRRECPKCGATYHVDHKPSSKGDACEQCGEALIIRDDDQPETIQNRLKVYYEQSAPLKTFYQGKGILRQVNADAALDAVTEEVYSVIGAKSE